MPIQAAVTAINRWDRLSKERFDGILAPFGVDPDNEELVSALIDHGWHCTPWDDEFLYVREVSSQTLTPSPV